MIRLISSLVLLLLAMNPGHAAGKIDGRLAPLLERLGPGERAHAWVFFTDKGTHEALRDAVPPTVVSDRSLQRRARVRPADALVDPADLPVEELYIQQVADRVYTIRQRSRWLNGVSVTGTAAELRSLEALPFVRTVEPLLRAARTPVDPEPPAGTPPPPGPEGTTSFNYGSSYTQVNQMQVPAIHDLNNFGQDVVVGVFDNGFRLLTHEVFDTLRPRIIATYDFVDKKVSVVPNNPSSAFGSHGVNTLSTIGGFKTGQLIGPAFGATYILARTENDSSETPFEEDNWVAAIEWADSIGVDVTSTSLGYLDYDPPYASWTWEDMDGNTTAITRAADMAVGRGIVVVNSAGNEGSNPSRNTLGAPADGDSVFSIGAVTSTGTRSSFSSVGPTTSNPPRIKPDVMAMGSSVRVASATNPTGYGSSSGTSFSCPLAAGVVALMLHARPTDSPVEIMDAIRSTASRANSPDNLYGWGIVNALAALRPASAMLLSPPDGAPDQPADLTLLWGASRWATGYHLQVALDSGFTTLVLDDSTVADTLAFVSGLIPGTSYRWRVAARNLYGAGAFTPARTFTTEAVPPPGPPALVAPPDSATSASASVHLVWELVDGAAGYRVRVSSDPSFSAIVFEDSTLTDTTVNAGPFASGGPYHWQAQARNAGGSGAWSAVRRFSVQTTTARAYGFDEGWNMVALPLATPDRTAHGLFPSATSSAFRFFPGTGYAVEETLSIGRGYWVKFPAADSAFLTGEEVLRDTVEVSAGWNMVGGLSAPLDTAAVVSLPPGIRESGFYEYRAGYVPVSVLEPGRGYWVKVSQGGVLILESAPRRESLSPGR